MVFETFEQFEQFALTNKIKFSSAQKKLVDAWRKGYKLITVNQHRANGGEIYWTKDEGETLEYAGRVYKANQHIYFALNKCLSSQDHPDMKFAWCQREDVRY